MIVIYVVTWRWLDGSGSGPVSAHWTKAGAEQMLAVLEKHSDKVFAIDCVPCEPLP